MKFHRLSDIHDFPTRNKHKLCIPNVGNWFQNRVIRYGIPSIINNLPEDLLATMNTNIKSVTNVFKRMTLQNYDDGCPNPDYCYICQL